MNNILRAWAVLILAGGVALAQPVLVPRDENPILRIEAGGPVSFVSSVAFVRSPDADPMLYAAGWDQTVHAWRLQDGKWQYDPASVLRIPIGPGLEVAINSIATSADGQRVAIGGRGLKRSATSGRVPGLVWPISAIGSDDQLDVGMIYVFDRINGSVRVLRGHRGVISTLAFSPATSRHLVSYAENEQQGRTVGNLRVWDVDAGETGTVLAEQAQQVPPPQVMNRVAVTAADASVKGLRVAFVNSSPELLVWDVERNRLSRTAFERYPLAISWLSDGRLFAGAQGQLGTWSIPPGPVPVLSQTQHFRQIVKLPRDSAPLGSALGGDVLACVVGVNAGRQVELQVYDASDIKGRVGRKLWDLTKSPSIAVDPKGEWIAVGGNPDNSLEVYRVQDLLSRQSGLQTLRGQGQSAGPVQFVANGADRGLKLAFGSGRARILDLAHSRMVDEDPAWKPDGPQAGDLTAGPVTFSDRSQGFVVRQGTRQLWSQLSAGEIERGGQKLRNEVTTYAVCPATAAYPAPLLAVATMEGSEPILQLVDLSNSEVVRKLTGHTERIGSLAFSGDGRLLVSSADDRTFRIWWLADLKDSIASQGLIRGLEVSDLAGKVTVRSDRKSRLAPGTEISGVVEPLRDGKTRLVPFATAWEFHRYVGDTTPGTKLPLRVGPANALRTVPVTVDRAIDERKPLLSFFCSDPAAGRWVAWDALGKYAVSNAQAETLIGWHFNWGEPQQPVKFAPAGEYRQQNFDEKIIPKRLAQGPDLVSLPRAEPRLEVALSGEHVSRDPLGDAWIARSREVLLTAVTDSRLVAGVTWQIDDKPEVSGTATDPGEWTADLADAWAPGEHQLRIRLTTGEYPPRTITTIERIRFQDPAPQIKASDAQPLTDPEATLEATVSAAAFEQGKAVQVTARVLKYQENKDGDVQTKSWTLREAGKVSWKVSLLPGLNTVEWTAVNEAPLKGFEAEETARTTSGVEYRVKKVPQIHLAGVFTEDEKPLPLEPGLPLRVKVDRPKIRIKGTVSTDGHLEWVRLGLDSGELTPLKIEEESRQEFPLNELVALSPGKQLWRLEARSDTGGEQTVRIETTFQPPLPGLAQITVRNREGGPDLVTANVLVEGRDLPMAFVQASLVPPPDFLSRKLAVRPVLNGMAGAEIEVAAEQLDKPLRFPFDLGPGRNRIELEIQDEWSPPMRHLVRTLTFQRPPHVTSLKVPETVAEPFVSLASTVRSADGPLQRVELRVDGKTVAELEAAKFPGGEALEVRPQADQTWQVTAKKLAIPAGKSEIQLVAWNDSGASLRIADLPDGQLKSFATTEYKPVRKIAPPVIRPGFDDETTHANERTIEFRVQSEAPLTAVRVIYDRQVTPLKVPAEAGRDAEFTHTVSLLRGTVPLEIQAENEGGRSIVRRTINRIEPPSLVRVRGVFESGTNRPLALLRRGGGIPSYTAATKGKVRIEGTVDQAVKNVVFLRLWVNGFLSTTRVIERPVAGGKAGARERVFTAEVTLSRPVENRIELELPDQPVSSNSLLRLQLDCREPDREQSLHLVMIGADSSVQLNPENVLTALGRGRGSNFRNDRIYSLPEDFNDAGVYGRLIHVRSRMLTSKNPILLVCYVGRELVDRGEIRLQTQTEGLPLESRRINRLVANAPGAHLLFVDAIRAEAGENATPWPEWPADPRLGLLRLVWDRDLDDQNRLIAALQRAMDDLGQGDARLQLVAAAISKQLRGATPPQRVETRVPVELQELVLGGR